MVGSAAVFVFCRFPLFVFLFVTNFFLLDKIYFPFKTCRSLFSLLFSFVLPKKMMDVTFTTRVYFFFLGVAGDRRTFVTRASTHKHTHTHEGTNILPCFTNTGTQTQLFTNLPPTYFILIGG